MTRFNRLGALAVALLFALSLGVGSALAAGDPEPRPMPEPKGGSKPPPVPRGEKKEDKGKKKSEQQFRDGYRAAYAAIYDRSEYAGAISQLKALGHDDRAEVANLIGYSYRKLGNYQVSQIWYERALKADPAHVRTWQYYGLWQLERGNREQAQFHLNKIASLCGTDCDEYRSLADALNKPPGAALVY